MFRTIEERQAFIDKEGLHINEDGDILDDEGGMYNPWCFAYERDGKWFTVVGVQTTHDGALRRLYELKRNNPTTRFKMFRGNDFEYLTIYTE